MKKLYTGMLIMLVVLLTGCSFKGSMAQPTDGNTNEPSELQVEVENSISNETDLKEKTDNYQKAVEDILNSINGETTTDENQ